MQATYHEVRTNRGWTICLCLITVIALVTACTAAQAQTLIGSAGAGWQTWNLALDADGNYVDLNSNLSPYWDVPFLTFNVSTATGGYGGDPASKSIGYCLTSTGDCQGVGSALFAPGPIPYWGMKDYNSANDTGGTMDPTMYFRTIRGGQSYQATLFLNTATNTTEINEFGWFQTNSTGTLNGTKHVLFRGSGITHDLTPDPVGTTVTFTPTQYFGFYYSDVSDEEDDNGPPHGCWASTIFAFNDEDCTAAGDANNTGQGDHVFAIFLQQVPGQVTTYWVAGQDPSMCSDDGDCNLTVVRVRRTGSSN
jgi:hypothetical protein